MVFVLETHGNGRGRVLRKDPGKTNLVRVLPGRTNLVRVLPTW
jgi:hypothetical protein